MLDALNLTLEALLKQELPNVLVLDEDSRPLSITFGPPNSVSEFPAINLFLYDIRENLELRSSEWRLTRNENGTASREPPPVRIDCSYMVTAWAGANSGPISDLTQYQTEHQFLGAVMKVLLRHPKLPKSVLQGELKDQEPPCRAFTARQSRLQSGGEYWQAMEGKPKTMFNYTITVSMPVHDAESEVPLVMQAQIGDA